MPLNKSDAERALDTLWHLRSHTEEVEELDFLPVEDAAFSKAISILHCYLTDVLPIVHPSIKYPEDNNIQVTINSEADLQQVEVICSTNRDPGLTLLNYSIQSHHYYFISQIEKGTVADRAGIFKRGDVILDINNHNLSRVTPEKTRWLLRSAARSGRIILTLITCDGRVIPYAIRKNTEVLEVSSHQHPTPMPIQAEVHAIVESHMQTQNEPDDSDKATFQRRPSFTPSIGSKDSDHETLINTVEVAAHFSQSSLRYSGKRLRGKNQKLRKFSLSKDKKGSLGMRLFGGKGTKFGDIGIFVATLEEDGAALKDGRIKKGDEILMINGKSVVGLRLNQVVQILHNSQSPVHFLVATKNVVDDLTAQSSVSLESTAESEVHQLIKKRELLSDPSPSLTQDDQTQGFRRTTSTPGHGIEPHPLNKKQQFHKLSDQTIHRSEVIELKPLKGPDDSPPRIATLSEQPITQWGRLSGNNIRYPPPPQPTKKTIVLLKSENQPLGFSLCGGKGSKRGDIGIFVRNITKEGIASKDGRLCIGDEILSVNGISFSDCTHKEAAHLIKSIKNDVVSLVIRPGPGYLSIPNKLHRSLSVKGTPSIIVLHRGVEELGLEVAGLTDDRDEYGIFINHIVPNSPADVSKELHRADQLISINEQSLLDVPVEEAQHMISAEVLPYGDVTIEIVRPHSIEPLNKLLSNIKNEGTGYWKGSGSFRMKEGRTQLKQKSLSEEEVLPLVPPPPSFSPLDYDIIDLFTPNKLGSAVEMNDLLQSDNNINMQGASEFPALVNAIKESTETEGEESILASMTPMLTRPSIISQYSSESPRGSVELVHKRDSGLIMSETDHSEVQETSFIKTTQDDYQITSLLPLSAPPVPIPSDEDGLPIQSTLPRGFQELVLTIKRRGKRGMGITLVNSRGITQGYPLIHRALPKGLGIKNGLKEGDRLVSINSQSLQGLTLSEAMNMLSDAPSEYSLVIWRDPNYDMDASSSMYSESHTSVSDLGTESSSRPPTTDSLSSLLSTQRTKLDDDKHLSLQQEDLLSNELSSSPPLEVPVQSSSILPANLLPPPLQKTSSLLPPPPPTELPPTITTELPPPPRESPPPVPTELPPPPPPPRESPPPVPTELPPPPPPRESPPPVPTELPPPPPRESPPPVPTELPPPPRESPPPVPTELPPPPPRESPPPVPTELPPPPPRESPPPVPTELPPPPRESPPPVPTELPSPPPRESPPPVPTELPPPPRESPPPVPTELPPPPRESPPPVPTELPPPPPPRESPPPVPTELPPPSLTETSPVFAKAFHRKSPPRPPPYGSPRHIKAPVKVKEEPPLPRGRQDKGPFEVEVTKGLRNLGLTMGADNGMIVVKNVSARALVKEGNIKPGDQLLSINNEILTDLKQTEAIVKALPRGPVKIIAMAPPRDVTGIIKKEPLPPTKPPSMESGLGHIQPIGRESDEGVISVQLSHEPGTILGIELEGGVDTPQQNIYIKSIQKDSVSDLCGKLQRGDQLLSCGEACFVGLTSLEAWDILNRAPPTVEIIVARKKESLLKLRTLGSEVPMTTTTITTQPHDRKQIRRQSLSLHFATSGPTTSTHTSSEDIRETPTPPPRQKLQLQEEEFTVVLHHKEGQKLGFSIQGGSDDPSLPHPHVKFVDPTGLAANEGQLRRGDKLISVNGNTLDGITHKNALLLLKNAGENVTLQISRQVSRSSMSVSLSNSNLPSKQISGNNSPGSKHSSGSPSPILSRPGLRGKRTLSMASRLGLSQSQGVKVVELHKGPTGLGMHLNGSLNKDKVFPITIKEVLPGGAAYKSNKINIGDVLLEANNIEFENMTQSEAVKAIKGLPQGTVRLVLLDKHYSEQQ